MTPAQRNTLLAFFVAIGVTSGTLLFKDGGSETINAPATQPTTAAVAGATLPAQPWPARPAGPWASLTPPKSTRPPVRVTNGQQLAAAIASARSGDWIQCAAGDYSVGSLVITQSNVRITGESGAVLIGTAAPKGAIFTIKGSRVWIEGFKLDGNRLHAFDVSGSARDLNVTSCSVTRRMGYFVNVARGAIGVRVFKNAAPDGITDNFVYTGEGSSYIEVESNFNPRGSIHEHLFRMHSEHWRVIDNDFAMNINAPGSDGRPVLKGYQARIGSDGYIGFNRLGGAYGQVSIGPLFDAGNAGNWLDGVIIEHNTMKLAQFQITEGARGLAIRSNAIDRSGGTVFSVQDSPFRTSPPSGRIENNTLKGSTFINGDASKLQRTNNTMNGAKLAA